MESFNIVEFIERNPLTKLSDKYNNRLLCKIVESFGDFEQKLFVSSFFCYLNYNSSSDFVVDLDNIWKWLGFQSKYNAERVLVKHFKLNNDYKFYSSEETKTFTSTNTILTPPQFGEAKNKSGGHNIKKIFLTVKTFKLFYLKAQTSKSSEVHEYYLKLEDVFQQVVEEESFELKRQLSIVKENVEVEKEKLIKEKRKALEAVLVEQFPTNTECIYFGTIDNTNGDGETLVKFGQTNDLHIRTIEVNGKLKTELIAYDQTNFPLRKLSHHIKNIIHCKTYSIENFNRLLKENEDLKKANLDLVVQLEDQALAKKDLHSDLT
jgi:hypothetical protein